jgi:hypothetical protein
MNIKVLEFRTRWYIVASLGMKIYILRVQDKNLRGNCVSILISESNCKFTPHFSTLWFYPGILKWRISLPISRYVTLTVLNMMQIDRSALCNFIPNVSLSLWFHPNPDFNECSWFYRKFLNRFQIVLNYKVCMKMQHFYTILATFQHHLTLFSTTFQQHFNTIFQPHLIEHHFQQLFITITITST